LIPLTPLVRQEIERSSITLRQYFAEMQAEHERLKQEIAALQARLNQNCTNSSQPPSSSPFIKPQSLRIKTGRKPGGQPGHPGSTLKLKDNPDVVIEHKVEVCHYCGCDLSTAAATLSPPRQVGDVKIVPVVTHHQVQSKTCPACGQITTAAFPQGIDHYIQYGDTYKSLMIDLNKGNFIPYERLAEISHDILNIPVSQGTLVNIVTEFGQSLQGSLIYLKNQLQQSPVVHFDETGTRIQGKNYWLHSAGNELFTYMETQPKRGQVAMESIGILPGFSGTAVHDFLKSYYHFNQCKHAICNAHILRELNGIEENFKQTWPGKMKELLLEVKQTVEDDLGILMQDQLDDFNYRYDTIVRRGEKENPLPKETGHPKRGRKAKGKARNLVERLRDYKEDILRFMNDPEVPFDNNQAERDIRMNKLQLKVSGGFRSVGGSRAFDGIRSYIATAVKQGRSVFQAIQAAVSGKPCFTAENP
jgi:transposase